MSDIYCKTCGVKAWSKCPNCRNVFMENQSAALLGNVLSITLDEKDLKVEMTRMLQTSGDKMTLHQMAEQLYQTLGGLLGKMDDPWLKGLTLDQFTCHHKWAWSPGCKSSIGCGCTLNQP